MSEPTAKIGDLGSAPIIPMILIALGGYLTWFGVHYWRRDITWPSDPVKSVLQGKGIPAPGAIQTSADILTSIQTETPGSGGSDGASNSTIAEAARPYATIGHSSHDYFLGGAPGKDGKSPWDCSSMDNWLLAVKLGLAIPGYKPGEYDGSIHGPTTLSYLAWTGATTVGHSADEAQPGDLCVSIDHMGISLGSGQMVSALQESLGTQQTGIADTFIGQVLYIRRVNGTGGKVKNPPPAGSPVPTGGGSSGSGGGSAGTWWVFATNGNDPRFYAANAPNKKTADEYAKEVNATVFGGPFPSKSDAEAVIP